LKVRITEKLGIERAIMHCGMGFVKLAETPATQF
jgi:hypothetical protein